MTERQPVLPWHIWPGHGAPFTAAEEARFVAELESSTHRPSRLGDRLTFRDSITAVVTALRCGALASAVLRFAPGLDPRQMLAAYRETELQMTAAATAWRSIVAEPTHGCLRAQGPSAATLLPRVVRELVQRSEWMGAAQVRELVEAAAARVTTMTTYASSVEEQMRHCRGPARYRTYGRRLLNPYEPGLWSHPYFLPGRVGVLTPLRLDDLMKEREP